MYSNSDKKDFILKDIKYAIGQGVGNAFSKAVDIFIALKDNYSVEIEKDNWSEVEGVIKQWRDNFFESNQIKIQEEYQKWLEENEDDIDKMLGLAKEEEPEPL